MVELSRRRRRRISATAILRLSINTFLKHYTFFTTTAALLALPFSLTILLSQTTLPPTTILAALFAGFPRSSQFFSVLSLKLSQTISLTLPFSFTFLLISKSAIIAFLLSPPPPPLSLSSVYRPLVATFLCNSLAILSAAFSLLFLAYNALKGFSVFENANLVSAAVVYSIFIAHAIVISTFAVILSGKERIGGYFAILKACVMIRGGAIPTALSLAIPMNMAMAAVEALFQYRVVRAYHKEPRFGTAVEGLFVAYLYSIVIVVDTIVSCIFFKYTCILEESCVRDGDDEYHCRIQIPHNKQLCQPES